MRGAEAGGFWYSRSATAGMFTHTRSGRGRICHFLGTMMVWGARFRSGRGKLGVGPISCGAVFAPAPPPLRDRACVNACNDLCWCQFSARVRPRMCERTFMHGDRMSLWYSRCGRWLNEFLGYDLSWVRVDLCTSCLGYELSLVQDVLGKSCLGYELSRSPCC